MLIAMGNSRLLNSIYSRHWLRSYIFYVFSIHYADFCNVDASIGVELGLR
jgi:hypothetical protein